MTYACIENFLGPRWLVIVFGICSLRRSWRLWIPGKLTLSTISIIRSRSERKWNVRMPYRKK
jgi:hypothetical protein